MYLARKVPYFTLFNLQPWTIKSSTNLMRSLQEPSRLLRRISASLKKISPYPEYENERTDRRRTFYTINNNFLNSQFPKVNKNYEIFFFVLKYNYNGSAQIKDSEVAELKKYGTVEILSKPEDKKVRAKQFKQFIESYI